MAGNPALSAPDAGRLEEALPMLDAMISVDNWLNETSRHAHVILPGLSALEQPHCDEALWGFAVRSAARWSPAIFPRDDRPQEWEILIRLGAILAGVPAADVDVQSFDDMLFAERAGRHGVDCGGCHEQDHAARPGSHCRPHDPGVPMGRRLRHAARRPDPRVAGSTTIRTASTSAR